MRRAQGASARSTNRSETGNKGLVKTGANMARVVVRMRNAGTDAYRPEEFGHTIIIERSISAAVRARRGARASGCVHFKADSFGLRGPSRLAAGRGRARAGCLPPRASRVAPLVCAR
jgi:hypothetical protein